MDDQSPRPKRAIILLVIIVVILGFGLTWYLVIGQKSPVSQTTSPTPTVATSNIPAKVSFEVVEKGVLILTGGYADPSVVKTTAGYRMYVNTFGKGPSGYLTYTSTDGQTWVKEKDIIIAGVATGRAIILPNGVRFYYPGTQPIKASDPPADMFSSFSTDGLTFTKDAGVRLKPRSADYFVEGPTVFQLPDKSWRMYFNENETARPNDRRGAIWGASSTDGLAWTRDEKVTLESNPSVEAGTETWPQALHPFVLANPSGGYLMFYNAHSELYAASSTDGLSWTKLGKVGIHGADADGYFQADGSIRLYYGDFSEATGGVVYTAVVKIKD